VDIYSYSDETVVEAKLKLMHKVAANFGQHTSSGGASNPSTYASVFVGVLSTLSDGTNTVAIIFRRQAEVSLNFTNPFLDGILRPPIA